MGRTAVRVLVGYDGSLPAGVAIEECARLLPGAHAVVVHLWTPPFASEQLRRRLWRGTQQVDAFVAAVEREGQRESDRVAGMGVALARTAGWTAEPLTVRCYGGEGFEFTEVARKVDADLLLFGSRGLGGTRAVLGSVSDMAVHYATQPALVAPYPLLAADDEALNQGPVLVAWDGSAGAANALAEAVRLWPQRQIVLISVDHDVEPVSLAGEPAMTVQRVNSRHEGSAPAIADALAAAARDHRAAVMVLGSRGRSAGRELIVGSVAMSTLHRAHRMVMIVHSREESGTATAPGS
ncbi:universal stress protein [Winogradskya consettensis]|uniref:Universal stress protein n=1 Tax=Winogradskya consettensis TaxID=113560 RepID=A0A919SSI7_9ACTN|nr:universal stress protein [Actinoplanes consettensis]GIM76774.1 universal stress protein [Actinoplanes consettensis]